MKLKLIIFFQNQKFSKKNINSIVSDKIIVTLFEMDENNFLLKNENFEKYFF